MDIIRVLLSLLTYKLIFRILKPLIWNLQNDQNLDSRQNKKHLTKTEIVN